MIKIHTGIYNARIGLAICIIFKRFSEAHVRTSNTGEVILNFADLYEGRAIATQFFYGFKDYVDAELPEYLRKRMFVINEELFQFKYPLNIINTVSSVYDTIEYDLTWRMPIEELALFASPLDIKYKIAIATPQEMFFAVDFLEMKQDELQKKYKEDYDSLMKTVVGQPNDPFLAEQVQMFRDDCQSSREYIVFTSIQDEIAFKKRILKKWGFAV